MSELAGLVRAIGLLEECIESLKRQNGAVQAENTRVVLARQAVEGDVRALRAKLLELEGARIPKSGLGAE